MGGVSVVCLPSGGGVDLVVVVIMIQGANIVSDYGHYIDTLRHPWRGHLSRSGEGL